MNTLLHSNKIVKTISFDKETACKFVQQCYPEMKSYTEFVEHAAKIAGYIPGCLSKNFKMLEDLHLLISRMLEVSSD